MCDEFCQGASRHDRKLSARHWYLWLVRFWSGARLKVREPSLSWKNQELVQLQVRNLQAHLAWLQQTHFQEQWCRGEFPWASWDENGPLFGTDLDVQELDFGTIDNSCPWVCAHSLKAENLARVKNQYARWNRGPFSRRDIKWQTRHLFQAGGRIVPRKVHCGRGTKIKS